MAPGGIHLGFLTASTARRLAVALMASMAAFAPSRTSAFGLLNGLGQHAEHRQITQVALSCAARPEPFCLEPHTFKVLAGGVLGGALGRADMTILAFEPAAHCDNGDALATPGYPNRPELARRALEACRAWMTDALGRAVANTSGLLDAQGRPRPAEAALSCLTRPGAKCAVLREFGLVLHAAQDFYAHTNWTDQSDPTRPVSRENPPGLGHDGPAPWISLRAEADWPDGLMSGCFQGVPELLFCNTAPGGRVKHKRLNKDTGLLSGSAVSGSSQRGRIEGNFARAAAAARLDTEDKWRLLQDQIVRTYGPRRGPIMICLLRHDDPAACARRNVSTQGGGE